MRLVDFSRALAISRESAAGRPAFRAIRSLLRRPAAAGLAAETRVLTFLVCRLRGFSQLAAELADEPETLARIVRLVMAPAAEAVLARGGTIDRLGAGELVAFFNAPLEDPHHATRACGAAIAMRQGLEKANHLIEQAGRRDGSALSPVDVGIGIFTGSAIVGDFGSDLFPAYTAIGPAAALAGEIEKISEVYGAPILADEATRRAADKTLAFLEVDHVAFGGGDPVRLHAVLGTRLSRANPSFMALTAFHDCIFESYRAGEWARAKALIAQARQLSGANPKLYDLYARRIANLERQPPGRPWTGVLDVSAPAFSAMTEAGGRNGG